MDIIKDCSTCECTGTNICKDYDCVGHSEWVEREYLIQAPDRSVENKALWKARGDNGYTTMFHRAQVYPHHEVYDTEGNKLPKWTKDDIPFRRDLVECYSDHGTLDLRFYPEGE